MPGPLCSRRGERSKGGARHPVLQFHLLGFEEMGGEWGDGHCHIGPGEMLQPLCETLSLDAPLQRWSRLKPSKGFQIKSKSTVREREEEWNYCFFDCCLFNEYLLSQYYVPTMGKQLWKSLSPEFMVRWLPGGSSPPPPPLPFRASIIKK